ncbi:MAG: YCF48-related protein [Opitutaceae bacterium]|nr:YCF48-related protein [Opitutaceae bacterium]
MSAGACGASERPGLLLDGAVAGRDIIVVGERGAIFRSADNGRTWERAASLMASTLTGISFAGDAKHGWVVGHEALIVASADGGRSWQQQYKGANPEESFLDVLALDAHRAIAVGAYGLLADTSDGGATWHKRKVIDDDYHLNRITRGPGGTLYIAGEHGTLLRSTDEGAQWTRIAAPYEGSFYGILPLDPHRLLAHGLRGHVYRSTDDGQSWERVATPQPVLLAAALRLKSNDIVLAGQARGLLVSRDFGRSFAACTELTTAVAELLELPDGTVLALGESGAAILSLTPR